MTSIATYRESRELYSHLVLRELRSKYKRAFLGWTWSLANPLANMIVYTLVFKYFLRVAFPTSQFVPSHLDVFALYLLCGLLPWNYFQGTVMGSIGSLTGNAQLIKKTYFPRELLPAATAGANIVFHLIEMALLVVALVAFGDWRAAVDIPWLLLLMAITAVFALGMGLLMSSLNVYFRDVEHFMAILFLIWLYMSAVVFPIFDIHNQTIVKILKLNPMTDMAQCYRYTLYYGTRPSLFELGYYGFWAIFFFVLGLYVFNRLSARLAEEL